MVSPSMGIPVRAAAVYILGRGAVGGDGHQRSGRGSVDLSHFAHGYDSGRRIGYHLTGNDIDSLFRRGIHDVNIFISQPHADIAGGHVCHHDLRHSKRKRTHQIGHRGGTHGTGPGDDSIHFSCVIHLHDLDGSGFSHRLNRCRTRGFKDLFFGLTHRFQDFRQRDIRKIHVMAAAAVQDLDVAAGFGHLIRQKL